MSIHDILLTQQREIEGRSRDRYIDRDVSLKGLGTPIIKVISGPRRAGKSFFAMRQLRDAGDLVYVNFDDERLIALQDNDELVAAIQAIGAGSAPRLLLDEVQNLPHWELFVNRLSRQGFDLTITGSNAHLLSSELSTHLTGRYLETVIFPFSFSEYLRLAGPDITEAEKQQAFISYARQGGYPEPLIKGINHRDYLSLLFDSMLYKDIVKRCRVRNPASIEDLAMFLLSNICTEYSLTTLSKVTSVRSVHTVRKYLLYLEEAFLFFSIPRFSYKAREQITANRKIYCIDNGFPDAKAPRHSENTGRLFENLVAIDLRYHELTGAIRVSFWKNESQEEVDFVIQRGKDIVALIQVCSDPSDPRTLEREKRALLKAGRDLSCKSLILLTGREESTLEDAWFGIQGTIQLIPLWKWFTSGDRFGMLAK
jgi:predicted AAA+ superfamily ATPase